MAAYNGGHKSQYKNNNGV